MRETITINQSEANQILTLLANEIPIKYLAVVQAVQSFFDQRFRAVEDSAVNEADAA